MVEGVIKWSDILKIYYITDTDNCFKIKKRHLINKKECLNKLFNLRKIGITKNSKEHPFEVIFFGNNLEHVLYNKESGLSDKEKEELSQKFAKDVLNGEKILKVPFYKVK